MNLFSKFKIPYSEDKIFGFLLLSLIAVSLGSVPAFSEGYDNPRLIFWSLLLSISLFFYIKNKKYLTNLPVYVIVTMALMWCWALLATIFSLDIINSLVGINIRMTSSLWFFTLWPITIFLFSGLEENKLLILLKTWVVIGGIISIWAILQFFGFGFYEGVDAPVRALIPSFLANPNFAGMFISSTIFISSWYAISKISGSKFRIFACFCLGLNIFSLVIFASRGAIIGVLLGLTVLILGYALKKKWKIVLWFIGIAVVLAGLSSLYLNAARDQRVSNAGLDLSAQQRWYLWDDTFQNIAKHPLTGTGLGNYFIAFRLNDASYFAHSDWFDDAHNIFLQLAVNGGVPLLLVFLFLLGFVIYESYHHYRHSDDDFPLYILAALVSLLFAASFNPVTVSNWFLLGLLIALSFKYLPVRELQLSSIIKKVGLIIAAVLLLVGLAFFGSEISLLLSDSLKQNNNLIAIRLNKVSFFLNPTNTSALSSLARKQFDQKLYDESYQSYLKLERLHSKSAYVLELAGSGYLDLYQETKDIKYKEEVYRVLPNAIYYFNTNASTHYNVAILYFKLEDYPKALAEAKTAVIRSDGVYNAWILLAQIYEKIGQVENQKKALQSAFRVGPSVQLRRSIND